MQRTNVPSSQAKAIPIEAVMSRSPLQSLTDAFASVGRRKTAIRRSLPERAVHNLLGRMTLGSLTVTDEGRVYEYGSKAVNDPSSNGHVTPVVAAHIDVRDKRVYQAIAFDGVVGAAEAYINGYWDSPDLLAVVRFMLQNMPVLQQMNEHRGLLSRCASSLIRYASRNTLDGSRNNIASHYDLGNDFFALFLDPTMMYSSACFTEDSMSLEQASIAKLERICQKLQLTPHDHLVEIGTGWGGMAIYAAKHFGCHVTTTTISREQYDYAKARVLEEGLEDRITVLCKDYRDLQGQYDKLVSIEMIEAVGYEYYPEYFARCASLLKPNGLMMIQAITVPDQRFELARKNVDFIKRYIFPGGCLPSLSVIANQLAEHTDMSMIDLFDMTDDYAKTLEAWRLAFMSKLDAVMQQGCDEAFIRMWEYYLSYCEGGFRERAIGTCQLLMAKPDYRTRPI